MDDSMVRLQRLEDERKQWSAQVGLQVYVS